MGSVAADITFRTTLSAGIITGLSTRRRVHATKAFPASVYLATMRRQLSSLGSGEIKRSASGPGTCCNMFTSGSKSEYEV